MATSGYERGDVRYLIETTELNGQFAVRFTCLKCNRTFQGDALYDSEGDGIGRTKAKLFTEHHVPVHVLTRQSSEK